MTERPARWRGAVGAAAFLAAVGGAAGRGVLLLAAVVPLVYVVYGTLSDVDVGGELTVERRIDPTPAPPGRPVTVTVTVGNAGERTLPDVRVVDAVPDELAVVDGTPRGGAALDAGEALTVEYVVAARRGEYRFEPPQVRLRSLGAGTVETRRPPVSGDETLVCRLAADAPPLEEQGDRYVGHMSTDSPGRGMEFHSTREYRPDDPASRIDWRHYAKRGDLATVNYRRRLAATVVLVVDARPASRVVAGPGRPSAVELGAYAATRALSDLLGAGHEVGVAVLGDVGPGPDGLRWLPPGGGRDHRAGARAAFEAAVETAVPDPPTTAQIRRVAQLAPPGAQVVYFTPLLDDEAAGAVEAWTAHGFPTTVLSPDVLTTNTISGQFEAVQRHTRLARCQATGARTVDWRRGTPLPIALEYAFAADARTGGTASVGVGGGGTVGTGTDAGAGPGTDRDAGAGASRDVGTGTGTDTGPGPDMGPGGGS